MFKSPTSFKTFNRLNDRRRSQNNDTMPSDIMHSTVESPTRVNANQQRFMKPRTYSNKTLNGRGETSAAKSTTNQRSDNEERRLSYSNDSPLSFTGSASFYHSESPSRSATNLPSPRDVSNMSSSASANSAKRHTIAVDSSDVDVAAAIALLQELKKRASPEDLILLHKALLPTRNAERVITLNQPEKRDDDEPLSPLIRRSSLLPAGVKTRLSRELLRNFSETNVQATRSTSREPAKTPKLDVPLHFDALDLANESFETQGNRPITPSDLDCPQIGTYKHGSLRITNGASSPDSGLILNRAEKGRHVKRAPRQVSAPQSPSGDVFVSADEGEAINETVQQARAVRIITSEPRKSFEAKERRPSMDARPKSSGRVPSRRSSEDQMTKRPASRAGQPQPQSQRASVIAQEYMSECDLPTDSHLTSPPPLTTVMSRLSTVADESPTEEGAGSREDALKRLNGEPNASNARVASRSSQSHLAPMRPHVGKSDSGYSSEARRPNPIVKESQVDEFLSTALDAADHAERSRSKDSIVADSVRCIEQHEKENTPASPVAENKQISNMQKAEKHRSLPSFFTRKTPSTTSVNTLANTPSTPPARQSRKLQKSRPLSQRTVSGFSAKDVTPEPEPVVPAMPEEQSVNFSRPTFERSTTSAEPSPQFKEGDSERRGRGRDRKSKATTADASPSGDNRRRSIFRFRSRSRSKSQHRHEEPMVLSVTDEPLPTFSDFGTVAQSLGQSPYDIATRQVKEMGPYDTSKPRFHPHEISRATPQPGADSDMQLPNRYSRGESMDRAEQDKARSQSRPRGRVEDAVVLDVTPAVDANSSRPVSRGRFFRSRSAHPAPVVAPTPVPELPKKAEVTSVSPSRDGVVVGTIDFGNGVGQGRMAPILTKSEKAATRRRTQSSAPRARIPLSPVITEEAMPNSPEQQVPKVPAHAKELMSMSVPASPSVRARQPMSVPPSPSTSTPRPQRTSVAPLRIRHTSRPAESRSVPQSPVVPASPSMSSGWETQALAWRQRKQGANDLMSPASEKRRSTASKASPRLPPSGQVARNTPNVVVSRYITPQGSELAMHLGPDPYQSLHQENPTDLRAPQEDIPRTDSSSTYRTATSERTQDSFDSTDSAKYRAYRPSDALPAKELTSPMTQNRSSRSFDMKRRSTAPVEEQNLSYERYSGGLGFDWERGVGFGGSAGTRAKHDTKSARKSVVLSETFGVDLSDVPVFMVRQ